MDTKLVKPKLEGVYVEITSNCNLKCVYCYNNSGMGKNMSFQNIKTLLQQIIDYGGNKISLSGGEPLLHPNILQILKYIHDTNVSCTLLTNGTLIDDEKAKVIVETEVEVQVSLDGPNALIHDKGRGAGSFSAAMAGIRTLRQNGYSKPLSIKCVISEANSSCLEEFVKFTEEIKADTVSFSWLQNSGRAKKIFYERDPKSLCNPPYDYERIKNSVTNLKLQFGKFPSSCQFCTLPLEEMKFTLRVDVEGAVYPCELLVSHNFILGNFLNESISEILQGNKLNNFLNLFRLLKDFRDECNNCVWNTFCGGGCPAFSIANGSIFSTDCFCDKRRDDFKKKFKSLVNMT